jgi:hypothetical protein
MTEIQSSFTAENSEVTSLPVDAASPVLTALVRRARKNFKPARIARDADTIEALGASVKAPAGYGEDWADNVWQLSDMLKAYGLDVSVRIATALVPRDSVNAWGARV